MKRRFFLHRGVNAVSGALVSPALISQILVSLAFDANAEPDPLVSPNAKIGLTKAHWHVLAAVQEHLLPTEQDIPGAAQINALKYLHFFMSRPEFDSSELIFLVDGVKQLSDLSVNESGFPFVKLNDDQRESLLRKFESQSDGYYWLRSVLHYLMEALLSDPVYGGNSQQVGWHWLEIIPGFPRPTEEKKYYLL